MKNYLRTSVVSLFALGGALALSSCDVDKVEDGEVPSVKVEVDGEAKLPKYDVEGPKVTTGKKTVEVEVPTIDIDVPNEEDNEPNNVNDGE